MLKKEAFVHASIIPDEGILLHRVSATDLQVWTIWNQPRLRGLLQTGGSDQWGNLTAERDLIRRSTT